uniref:NADH dehydrogenase subunit 5 n=1 Tax=Corydalis trisecta TaxID=2682942 RepID=A0A8K1SNW3_9MAGN|nr:NADH dehydrogenase subunit 5 [Corydalis trisecta]
MRNIVKNGTSGIDGVGKVQEILLKEGRSRLKLKRDAIERLNQDIILLEQKALDSDLTSRTLPHRVENSDPSVGLRISSSPPPVPTDKGKGPSRVNDKGEYGAMGQQQIRPKVSPLRPNDGGPPGGASGESSAAGQYKIRPD